MALAVVCSPHASVAVALMTCVPLAIPELRHVAEQELVPEQVARLVLSAIIVMDAMLVLSLAVVAIFKLPPLSMLPFSGELILTAGPEGVVTEMLDDWADVLPAAL